MRLSDAALLLSRHFVQRTLRRRVDAAQGVQRQRPGLIHRAGPRRDDIQRRVAFLSVVHQRPRLLPRDPQANVGLGVLQLHRLRGGRLRGQHRVVHDHEVMAHKRRGQKLRRPCGVAALPAPEHTEAVVGHLEARLFKNFAQSRVLQGLKTFDAAPGEHVSSGKGAHRLRPPGEEHASGRVLDEHADPYPAKWVPRKVQEISSRCAGYAPRDVVPHEGDALGGAFRTLLRSSDAQQFEAQVPQRALHHVGFPSTIRAEFVGQGRAQENATMAGSVHILLPDAHLADPDVDAISPHAGARQVLEGLGSCHLAAFSSQPTQNAQLLPQCGCGWGQVLHGLGLRQRAEPVHGLRGLQRRIQLEQPVAKGRVAEEQLQPGLSTAQRLLRRPCRQDAVVVHHHPAAHHEGWRRQLVARRLRGEGRAAAAAGTPGHRRRLAGAPGAQPAPQWPPGTGEAMQVASRAHHHSSRS
eukprot:scaffold83_cov246-Pinguiococcus_pyrenoidosus.AAC.11